MGVLLIGYQFGVEFLKVACKAPFFNSFIYEVNYAVDTSSLRLEIRILLSTPLMF